MRKRAILRLEMADGTVHLESVLVIGETGKKYRILAERQTVYSRFGAFVAVGETALVWKDEIRFPNEGEALT